MPEKNLEVYDLVTLYNFYRKSCRNYENHKFFKKVEIRFSFSEI